MTDHHPHPHAPHPKRTALQKRRLLFNVTLGVVLGLVISGGVFEWQMQHDRARLQTMQAQASHNAPSPNLGGPFTLTDTDGKQVTDKDFSGKYLLIEFGYTFCPDMCPTGLQSISHALKDIGDEAGKVQPLFISIDPARDTPEKLKDFVASFGPNIIALRGNEAQTLQVTKDYEVYFTKRESEDGPDAYELDHSSLIYLMGPDGKYVTSFPDDADPLDIANTLRKIWGEAPLEASAVPAAPLATPSTASPAQMPGQVPDQAPKPDISTSAPPAVTAPAQ